MKILAVLPCVLLTACATTLSVTYRSDPPGATLYQNGQAGGYAPATAEYTPSEAFKKGGCMKLATVKAVWISGATASISNLQACAAQGYDQGFSFMRPDLPGRQMDVQWAIHREEADKEADAQTPLFIQNTSRFCTSFAQGNMVFTKCQ